MRACAYLIVAALILLPAGCGGSEATSTRSQRLSPGARSTTTPSASAAPPRRVSRAPVVTLPLHLGAAWRQVATVAEQPAAWIARRAGVTLMRFDQRLVHLVLHAGSNEPGEGWLHGDRIGPHEVHRVLAGFNGGFKLSYGSVGFVLGGRVAVAPSSGLGSIVTYAGGQTQIGAWHEGVPASGRKIVSVRQNLHLLVDHGVAAASVGSCVQECWGSTLGGGSEVPRSALGIDGEGQLVWAAGVSLTPAALAHALVDAGVQRAVELDINPAWVAGYLYVHRASGPTPVPVLPGQHGIEGELLAPYSRDFFTVIAN